MTFYRPNFVFGTFGDDVLTGTDGRDYVFSFFGDDEISTGAGNDVIVAGFGNDIINAGAGDDRIYGGFGFDIAAYEGGIADYEITIGYGWFGRTTVKSTGDVADAGKDTLIRERAFQRVMGLKQALGEGSRSGIRYLHAAGVEILERLVTLHDTQGRTLLFTRLGEKQRPGIEMKCGQPTTLGG